MSLNLNDHKGSGNRVAMAPGAYPAKVVCIIDLGEHQQTYKGESKGVKQEVAITYEFLDEFLKDENGEDIEDKPRWLTEMMPLHAPDQDRAKSTQRYKALDPENKFKGDLVKCIEAPVMVTVIHNPKKDGDGVWENISGLSPMRAKDPLREKALVNKPLVFDLDEPDIEVFLKLPQFIKDKIKKNLNFGGSKLEKLLEDVGDDSPGKGDTDSEPPKDAGAGEADGENPY